VTSVLVVDDEPRIASFVSRALAAEGFRVDSAPDGVHGFDLARSGRYELIVLDLLLPGMDGVTVLERLMDERPQQRVLVLSALSDVEEKVRCLELGASDYLSKPFALKELVARVRARLRPVRMSGISVWAPWSSTAFDASRTTDPVRWRSRNVSPPSSAT
jgi:DNA-binding response OmpR family regulator